MTQLATPLASRAATLDIDDARLYYEVRGQGPLLVLLGAPMDADAFAPLADELASDHTVLTTDPRGIHRSRVSDPDADSTPELRAGDVVGLIEELGTGPASVFGSSGGGVTALAMVQQRPDLLSTVIAHEPPLDELLEDRDRQRGITEDVCATYLSGDILGGWRKFLAQADITIPDDVLQEMFGPDRDPRVLADERYWFAHELRPSTWWRPDLTALSRASTPIAAGIGEDSKGQACDRTTRLLAAALHIEPVIFPGDHTGFVDNPVDFAQQIRKVLRSEVREGPAR